MSYYHGYYRYFHHNVSLWEKVFLAHYEICLQSLALYISIRSICCFFVKLLYVWSSYS